MASKGNSYFAQTRSFTNHPAAVSKGRFRPLGPFRLASALTAHTSRPLCFTETCFCAALPALIQSSDTASLRPRFSPSRADLPPSHVFLSRNAEYFSGTAPGAASAWQCSPGRGLLVEAPPHSGMKSYCEMMKGQQIPRTDDSASFVSSPEARPLHSGPGATGVVFIFVFLVYSSFNATLCF